MMPGTHDPLEYFRLRPIKAAKVSEISEATSASPVPPEERVNFHIGNPVQDERLYSAFFRLALGLDQRPPSSGTTAVQEALDEIGGRAGDREKLEFLYELIKKSAPYMPRGGYQRSNPHQLIRTFSEWLEKGQQDPLAYDLGEQSGVREIILTTGGIVETFRVFLHACSMFLLHAPARLFHYRLSLPEQLCIVDRISLRALPADEDQALHCLVEELKTHPPGPAFLALGKIMREDSRRLLRQISFEFPLFLIEANDSPNSTSLAREARMSQRVLRFLTPGVLSPGLSGLATTFVAGNPDFTSIMEVAHFQLKGTPSYPEVEYLNLLLAKERSQPSTPSAETAVALSAESLSATSHAINPIAVHTLATAASLGSITERNSETLKKIADGFALKGEEHLRHALSRVQRMLPLFDSFAGTGYFEMYEGLLNLGTSTDWQCALQQGFLSAFVRHHPEYDPNACVVVSGSSRTALGILGFHCGIRSVVIPDLSWNYEHCFPDVTAVPLREDLQLDVDGLMSAIEKKVKADPLWPTYGAVAINNPHNATGQTFRDDDVRRLLRWLLERNIVVIDDLAYQNVAPASTLRGPQTLRQLAEELVRTGYLTQEHASRVIAVHSVSKTDCLAGSRLAVVEIREPGLRQRFSAAMGLLAPNTAAIFLSYLFYRGKTDSVNAYWLLRNCVFEERMRAIEEASENLPAERNKYAITIRRPMGSMYPLMVIDRLPAGLSLDWLSSGLARQGIGLLPLASFARTEKGFEAGRNAFRLTLGGTDPGERLLAKTRRVLIDLNRMMAEEEARYTRHRFRPAVSQGIATPALREVHTRVEDIENEIRQIAGHLVMQERPLGDRSLTNGSWNHHTILNEYFPERLLLFRRRAVERREILDTLLARARSDNGKTLEESLDRELFKDSLAGRQEKFRKRMFDRTVHPTQMYSLRVELLWERCIGRLINQEQIPSSMSHEIAEAMLDEYAGANVSITSREEGDELLLDMRALLTAEDVLSINGKHEFDTFLSYWGDWDGSTRPSGQGHYLVGTVLVESVRKLAALFNVLLRKDPSVAIDPDLISEVARLDQNIRGFRRLLNEITALTHQLEKRYRGILPFQLSTGRLRGLGVRLHLASDPLTSLWQHNDRLERRMVTLRQKRKEALQYYFALNKKLRKTLHNSIPSIVAGVRDGDLAREAVLYRDILKRVVITPRIHQNMITSQDQFATDTTVHNVMEINDIAGSHGNPAMILSVQISMVTSSESVIALDRKLKGGLEETLRHSESSELPSIWVIPLFEDIASVKGIPDFLNRTWEYAVQSRSLRQDVRDRFSEIIPELFIAGSDLSQQVGQAAGMALFREAKQEIVSWLAQRDLVGRVRIKMGSGEPMQRQGGYYAPQSGLPAFITGRENSHRLASTLSASATKSVEYATTPLMGVFASGDLRTFQSNLAEQVRYLPSDVYAQLLLHVYRAQRFYERELSRAAEPLVETRLQFTARGLHELERLTVGKVDKVFDEFAQLSTDNFRHILYGKPEDVVGIHIVSYFIARTTPPLRDRPTFRPGRGVVENSGHQILEKISETIPLSRYGSLLRAISHNQAQTAVLGVSQLSTGLFRAFHFFSKKQFQEGTGLYLLSDRILPMLPVYELLHTLRLYHDPEQPHLSKMEHAFPAGNSALTALREDFDAMAQFLPLLKKELIRRHGLNVGSFFDGDEFHPELLPTLRPDLAVLLQPDLFNIELDLLYSHFHGPVERGWEKEVRNSLEIPRKIRLWRARAWELLLEPVYGRVQSFIELAIALSSLSDGGINANLPFKGSLSKRMRLAFSEAGAAGSEDSMKQFLSAAIEYLRGLSEQVEVPTTVVRALHEVERIIRIEEQALKPKQQEELKFYLLQIARLAGENG